MSAKCRQLTLNAHGALERCDSWAVREGWCAFHHPSSKASRREAWEAAVVRMDESRFAAEVVALLRAHGINTVAKLRALLEKSETR